MSTPQGLRAGALELVGYYRYDSGTPYRVWRLLEDAPHVPASMSWMDGVAGPAHAVAGDTLWEDLEDRGQVFRLKREDLVIGRPEWWQLGDLFGGTWPAWAPATKPAATPAAEEPAHPPRIRLARTNRRGELIWEVIGDIPECSVRRFDRAAVDTLRAGDYLLEHVAWNRNEPFVSIVYVYRAGHAIGHIGPEDIAEPLREAFPGGGLLEDFVRSEAEEADGIVLLRVAHDVRSGIVHAPAGSLLARSEKGAWLSGRRAAKGEAASKAHPIQFHEAARFLLQHRTETEPEARAALALILRGAEDDAAPSGVWRLERDIPGSDLRAGDVLARSRGHRPRTRGTCRPLSIADYEALRAVLDAGGWYAWLPVQDLRPMTYHEELTDYIANRNKWGLRRKVWTPDWFVVRPVAERPAVSIDARSDAEALSELLSQVGCKMPDAVGEP